MVSSVGSIRKGRDAETRLLPTAAQGPDAIGVCDRRLLIKGSSFPMEKRQRIQLEEQLSILGHNQQLAAQRVTVSARLTSLLNQAGTTPCSVSPVEHSWWSPTRLEAWQVTMWPNEGVLSRT